MSPKPDSYESIGHLAVTLVVVVGGFILILCHAAADTNVMPVITLLAGHYLGAQKVGTGKANE